MKTLTFTISFFLVLCLIAGTANAQSGQRVNSFTNLKTSQGTNAQAFPNPCNGNFILKFNSPLGGRTGITISDNKGNGMIAIDMVAKPGINSLPINISGYGQGTYSVIISGTGAYALVHVMVTSH